MTSSVTNQLVNRIMKLVASLLFAASAYAAYQVNWYSDSSCQDYIESCQSTNLAGTDQGNCGTSATVAGFIPIQVDEGGNFGSVDSVWVGQGSDNCDDTSDNFHILSDSSECYAISSGSYNGACLGWSCTGCPDTGGPYPGKRS